MELGLEIARLVIDSREDSECSEPMLQRALEIIESGSLLSIHTFVHQHCCLKFSPCRSVVLLEEWTIKIVPRENAVDKVPDGLLLKSAIRSYLHFSQLNSWVTCSEEQLSSDVYRLFSDKWLLPSPGLSGDGCLTASPSGIQFFYVPIECQNNEKEKKKSEGARKGLKMIFCEQPQTKDSDECKSSNLHSEKMPLENEQTIKLPVKNLLSPLASLSETESLQAIPTSRRETLPRRSLIASAFRFMSTASKAFSKTTGLPLNSSPAPFNRSETKFVGDHPIRSTRNRIVEKAAREGTRAHVLRNVPTERKSSNSNYYGDGRARRNMSSSSGLLCNFEESALNGRLDLVTSLDGFHLQIAASDETCSPHLTLPVTTFFFNMPGDEAPLPYMGFCSLENMRKGYRIPKKGIIQAVLFNPQGTVVRMFVVKFDVSDMPPFSQTFLRQRTFFMPVGCTYDGALRSWLKCLIHLSLATDRRGRLYVHTDIKMLFSQKNELETLNFELGKDIIKYQLQSFTEMPRNPKYSLRK